MSNQESNLNDFILDTERTARIALDLEIAQLKQNNPLASDQELQWRLNLQPELAAKGLVGLKESIEFALHEELRQAERVAESELPALVDELIFDMVACLMIYGRNKSD